MRTDIDRTKALYSFDSLREVFDYIETAPRTWRQRGSETSRATISWDLGTGFAGAMKYARNGWIEGAQRAQKALQSFTPKSPAPDQRIDFYGHMPHVPRFCAGAPDNMIRHDTPPTLGGGRVITLYAAINANAWQKAPYMANYGIGVAQYINQLENDGLRVELHACVAQAPMSGAMKRVAHSVCVKRADQPLDLAVVAFAIGHPAMFRRLWFALVERSAGPDEAGYYYPERVREADIIDFPKHGYILNGMLDANSQAPTPERALENVEREIKRAIDAMDEYA